MTTPIIKLDQVTKRYGQRKSKFLSYNAPFGSTRECGHCFFCFIKPRQTATCNP